MAILTTPTSNTVSDSPTAIVDPGIIAGTCIVGFVALGLDDSRIQAVLHRIQAEPIGWSNLVLLKLLVPRESQDVIMSPLGNTLLDAIVQGLLADARIR